MKSRLNIKSNLVAPLVIVCSMAATHTFAADTITEAVKNGQANLNLRLRFEDVDQDAATSATKDLDEDAFTLRTRLTLKTDTFQGFGVLLQFDDVQELDDVDYRTAPNDTRFAATEAPVIADPEGTEVNQAYLSFTGLDKTEFKWGRQQITLDNHRHVGHVGWRQNAQTYDGFSISNKSLPDTTVFLAYISTVKRIFGEQNAIGEHNVEDYLLNVKYEGLSCGTITGYYYDLEYEADALSDRSSQTLGLRFSGATEVSDGIKALYAVEYATQSDANNNDASYDADYTNIEAGIAISGVTIKVGQEVLGADDIDGSGDCCRFFQANLATLHKFQGWTDKFLNAGRGNIAGGIEDAYVSVGGNVAGVKLLAVYHDFSADDKDAAGDKDDYGDEIGFLVAKKFDNYGLALKYADYSADDHATDTSKLWLTATANY